MDSPQNMPQVGDLVAAKYRIISIIGEGGYGVVYRAYQETMRRDVAIKMLRPAISQMADEVERFRREVYNASCLKHPNTITLYDYGQSAQGSLYIVMEYLEGMNLRHWIHQRGPVTHDSALDMIEQILRSLREAHGQGIIHRDLKPENIFLAKLEEHETVVKVLDFGLSKAISSSKTRPKRRTLTKQGQVFGTPQYMSPEQAMGQQLSATSDVYAVGILAWEMLSGRPPFDGKKPVDILLMHVNNDLPPLPAAHHNSVLAEFIEHTTHKNPDARPADAGEALTWLVQRRQERARPVIVPIPLGTFQPSIKTRAVPPPRHETAPEWSGRLETIDVGEIDMRLAQLPLLGRKGELEELVRWGQQALVTGGVLWVTGEHGVGKTRLVEEWLRRMERTAPIQLRGAHRELGSPVEGLRHALEPLLAPTPEPGLRLPAGAVPAELIDEARHAIQPLSSAPAHASGQDWAFACIERTLYALARVRPVVLVLEDLHWADSFTQRLIEHWQDDLSTRAVPLVLVFTQRAEEQPSTQQLNRMSRMSRAAAGAAAFSYAHNVHLSRLDDTGALELLDELAPLGEQLRARILQASRGNPLYLTQIVRYLFEEDLVQADTDAHVFRMRESADPDANLLPPDLQGLMFRRVLTQLQEHRLGVVLRALMARAMVLGQRFEARLLKELLRREGRGDLEGYFDDALEAFAQSGIIVNTIIDGRPGLEFGFELLRHAVVERMVLDEGEDLATLHAHAAQTKEAFAQQRDPGLIDAWAREIATHWQRAHQRDRAFEWLMRAAEVAERAQDFREALDCLRKASELLDERLDPDGEHLLDIRLSEGRLFRNLGEYGAAEEALREAVEESRRVGDTVGEAITGEALASVLVLMTRYDEASALYEQIGTLYGQFDRAGQTRCAVGVGELARYRGLYAEARQRFEGALEDAEALGDTASQARALFGLGQCDYAVGELRRATERVRTARKLAEVQGDALLRSSADVELALGMLTSDHVEQAIAMAEQALEVKRSLGDTLGQAHAHLVLGMALRQTVRIEQAELHAHRSRTINERLSHVYGIAKAVLLSSELALERGADREAIRLMDDAMSLHVDIKDAHGLALSLLHRATCAVVLRQFDDVALCLERVESLILKHDLELYRPRCAHLRGRALEQAGRVREASMQFESGLQLAEARGQLDQVSRNAVGLARTRLVLGDLEAVRADIPRAMSHADAIGHAEPLAQALAAEAILARFTRDAHNLARSLRRLRAQLAQNAPMTLRVARVLSDMAEHLQLHQTPERAFALTLAIIEVLRAIKAAEIADDLATRLLNK